MKQIEIDFLNFLNDNKENQVARGFTYALTHFLKSEPKYSTEFKDRLSLKYIFENWWNSVIYPKISDQLEDQKKIINAFVSQSQTLKR